MSEMLHFWVRPMGLTVNPAQTLQAERLTYPGLLPREILIWQAWLKLHESQFTAYQYNVRVGTGVDPGPAYRTIVRQMAISNSQKRIDAVAWNGPVPTLFEVKFRAGAGAVGQLVVYAPLWAAANPNLPLANLALVTDQLQPDIAPALKFQGIHLYEVPTDFTSLVNPPSAYGAAVGYDAPSFVL